VEELGAKGSTTLASLPNNHGPEEGLVKLPLATE